MGAAYLCAEAGITAAVIENQAAYVAGWLKKLRDDRKLLIHAAAQAQHAADYILRSPAHSLKIGGARAIARAPCLLQSGFTFVAFGGFPRSEHSTHSSRVRCLLQRQQSEFAGDESESRLRSNLACDGPGFR